MQTILEGKAYVLGDNVDTVVGQVELRYAPTSTAVVRVGRLVEQAEVAGAPQAIREQAGPTRQGRPCAPTERPGTDSGANDEHDVRRGRSERPAEVLEEGGHRDAKVSRGPSGWRRRRRNRAARDDAARVGLRRDPPPGCGGTRS